MSTKFSISLQPYRYILQVHQKLLAIAPDAVLIGGAVRDLLLHRPVHDLDYVVTADALAIGRKLADALGGAYYPLDERRHIARVIWQREDGNLVVDIASLIGMTLLEDIQRRDFTINAIAMLPDGDLYDPLGGVSDLQDRILRPCSPDSLLNDPVRTIRAVRFLLDFDLKPAPGLDHLIWHAALYLAQISPERQRDEFIKTLALDRPHLAVEKMVDWRIADIMMPELLALHDVAQPPPHRFDAFDHTIQTLAWLSRIDRWMRGKDGAAGAIEKHIHQRLQPYRDTLQQYLLTPLTAERPRWLWLRFGAIAHDWGKASAFRENEEGGISFYRHEQESGRLTAEWMTRYRCARNEILFVRKLCEGHMRPMNLFSAGESPTRRTLFRFYRDMSDAAPGIILLFMADFLGARGDGVTLDTLDAMLTYALAWLRPFLLAETIVPKPLLKGGELMQLFGLKPGPELGHLLAALQEAQASGDVQNRAQALAFIEKWLTERDHSIFSS